VRLGVEFTVEAVTRAIRPNAQKEHSKPETMLVSTI
jgi:hypothetical protein